RPRPDVQNPWAIAPSPRPPCTSFDRPCSSPVRLTCHALPEGQPDRHPWDLPRNSSTASPLTSIGASLRDRHEERAPPEAVCRTDQTPIIQNPDHLCPASPPARWTIIHMVLLGHDGTIPRRLRMRLARLVKK